MERERNETMIAADIRRNDEALKSTNHGFGPSRSCRKCGDSESQVSCVYVIIRDDGYCSWCSRARRRIEERIKEAQDALTALARANHHPSPSGKLPTYEDGKAAEERLAKAEAELSRWLDW
jgi:hypothetical protein